MSDKKVAGAGSIQKGSYIILDNAACKVIDTQTSKSGKHGHAKIRIDAVGLIDEKKRIVVMPSHDNVEVPIVEKKNAQILNIRDKIANVMDLESYEIFDLTIPDEMIKEVKEGVTVLYWEILDQKVMKGIKPEG